MKVLVTGGAGYIGSVTANELLEAGHEVVIIDNLYQGHVEAVPPGATFVQGDLREMRDVQALFAAHPNIEGILHFAGYTLVGESMNVPFKYMRESTAMAANLLEVAMAAGVRRVIFSSTANLFDAPERIPIAEDERIVPGSPYGESKFMIERMLHWCERIYGARYACLRYFNACGDTPGRGEDHDPETHIIPLILQVALGQREHFTIYGDDYDTPDGTCIRDYVHVIDLASAHILALGAIGEIGSRRYNLGNGKGYSIREVLDAARRVTGQPIPAVVGPRRPGDPATLVASSETLRRELGWKPRYAELDQILASAWEWHQSHPQGYRKA